MWRGRLWRPSARIGRPPPGSSATISAWCNVFRSRLDTAYPLASAPSSIHQPIRPKNSSNSFAPHAGRTFLSSRSSGLSWDTRPGPVYSRHRGFDAASGLSSQDAVSEEGAGGENAERNFFLCASPTSRMRPFTPCSHEHIRVTPQPSNLHEASNQPAVSTRFSAPPRRPPACPHRNVSPPPRQAKNALCYQTQLRTTATRRRGRTPRRGGPLGDAYSARPRKDVRLRPHARDAARPDRD